MKKDVTLIIVNFNTKGLLRECLKSIFKNTQNLKLEVIVADNNSIDGSQKMIKKEFPQVQLIENKKNHGFARANNQGAKRAIGKYLFFLNSDTLVSENSIDKLLQYASRHPEVGLFAPHLVLKNKKTQEGAFGPEPTLKQLIFGRFLKSRKIDWVSGAAILIKKDLFEKIGGFDENYFMYFEDVDLGKRIRKAGYQIIVFPESKIIHILGRSIKKNRQRKKLYYQSQDYFYKKHYGKSVVLFLKMIRFPYKFIKLIK